MRTILLFLITGFLGLGIFAAGAGPQARFPWSKSVYKGKSGIALTVPFRPEKATIVAFGQAEPDPEVELTGYFRNRAVFSIHFAQPSKATWWVEPDRDTDSYTVTDAESGEVIDRLVITH